MPAYRILIHPAAFANVQAYRHQLATQGAATAGGRLQAVLRGQSAASLSDEAFLEKLYATKPPMIFAESEVSGDGTDWTPAELSLLGDIGVAVDVEVFDDGRHDAPKIHPQPLPATLLFIPGTLLRNDRGNTPADWDAATKGGRIDPEGYLAICQRRLTPLFCHANDTAQARGQKAFITVPGLGCGQFAGRFRGRMGEHLKQALKSILKRHARHWPAIRAVYFDPYNECDNEREEFGGLSFLVRPLLKGNDDKPQLLEPSRYAEAGDDFGGCRLFSLVAWDHVSWPGNDFYGGSRCTDDGVKAAATSAMFAMTGVEGRYGPAAHAYKPPNSYPNWEAVVKRNQCQIHVAGNLSVLG